VGPDDALEWRAPDPRLRRLRHLQVGLVTLPVVLVGAGLAAGVASGAGLAVVLAALVAGAAADVLVLRRVATWGFAERAEDLLVRRGVMIRRLSVIPYGRMQFVDVTAGPLERTFGLATVRMHTAAAASDARIPGLAAVDAARLRDQLAALGEHQSTGL
jgi:membrane protein YdbS with pleckstrin-like domain